MAVFSFGKKKKEEDKYEPAYGSPIEQVMVMRQQGMDNNQIIRELERQGYSSSQIFEAINHVDLSSTGFEQPAFQQAQPSMQTQQQDFSYPNEPYPQERFEKHPQQQDMREEIEEVAEAIIDEKWKEFEHDVKTIIEWKDRTETRTNKFEQRIKDLENSLNNLHKSLLNKISEYDKNIIDVGTEIKAMEKVFQKVLPSLTENVNKLERMAKGSATKK